MVIRLGIILEPDYPEDFTGVSAGMLSYRSFFRKTANNPMIMAPRPKMMTGASPTVR